MLVDFELTTFQGRNETRQTLADEEERLAVLKHTFGLEFPPGTRFPVLEDER